MEVGDAEGFGEEGGGEALGGLCVAADEAVVSGLCDGSVVRQVVVAI